MKERIITDSVLNIQKVENVPENFEELEELCEQKNAEILYGTIYICGLGFDKNGEVSDNECNVIATNRTPAQMWDIIKSLTEQK